MTTNEMIEQLQQLRAQLHLGWMNARTNFVSARDNIDNADEICSNLICALLDLAEPER